MDTTRNNPNISSSHAVVVLRAAEEGAHKVAEVTSTVLLTRTSQMDTTVLPKTKAHPRIKLNRLLTTLTIPRQASIKDLARKHTALSKILV
jgi:hypothetical protein